MLKGKLFRYILLGIIFAAVIYVAMAVYADQELVLHALKNFNWGLLPLLLILSLLNYFSRFLKWHYYLKLLDVKLSYFNSLLVFFSGLVMSITPAKAGEILKPYLVNKITNDSVAKTIPIVFAERVTDFLGMILLSSLGAFIFNYGQMVLVGITLFLLITILVISNKKYFLKFIQFLERFKIIPTLIQKVKESYESAFLLFKIIPLFSMILLSMLSWFFECYSLYLILSEFNISLSLFWVTFVYSFSTIVGAVSILPGGLGITEGSLTYLIHQGGFTMDISVLATFLVRSVTLWFAVGLGAVSLFFLQKRIPNINQ